MWVRGHVSKVGPLTAEFCASDLSVWFSLEKHWKGLRHPRVGERAFCVVSRKGEVLYVTPRTSLLGFVSALDAWFLDLSSGFLPEKDLVCPGCKCVLERRLYSET